MPAAYCRRSHVTLVPLKTPSTVTLRVEATPAAAQTPNVRNIDGDQQCFYTGKKSCVPMGSNTSSPFGIPATSLLLRYVWTVFYKQTGLDGAAILVLLFPF